MAQLTVYERAEQINAQKQAARAAQAQARAAELEANRDRSWGEAGSDVGVQLTQGALGLGQAAYGLSNMVSAGVLDRAVGLSDNLAGWQKGLQSAKSMPTQREQAAVRQTFKDEGLWAGAKEAVTNPLFMQDLLVSNAPSMIPALAVGSRAAKVAAGVTNREAVEAAAKAYAADAATEFQRKLVKEGAESVRNEIVEGAVVRTVGGQIAGTTNIDAINSIRDAGGSENLQQLGGLGAGAFAGLAGAGISKFSGAAAMEGAAGRVLGGGASSSAAGTTAAGVARGVGMGAGREALEEGAQSAVEQTAVNAPTPGKGLFDGVGESAVLGSIAGAMLGGAMGGVSSIRRKDPVREEIEGALGDLGAIKPASPPALPAPDAQGALPPPPMEGLPAPDGTIPMGQDRDPQLGYNGGPDGEYLPAERPVSPTATQGLFGDTDVEDAIIMPGPVAPAATVAPPTAPAPVAPPTATTAPPAVPTAAPASTQAAPSWKSHIAKTYGVKPQAMKGKDWASFTAAVDGTTPGTPEADAAVQEWANTLDPASAGAFATAIGTRLNPNPQTAPVTPVAAPTAAPTAAPVAKAQAAPVEDITPDPQTAFTSGVYAGRTPQDVRDSVYGASTDRLAVVAKGTEAAYTNLRMKPKGAEADREKADLDAQLLAMGQGVVAAVEAHARSGNADAIEAINATLAAVEGTELAARILTADAAGRETAGQAVLDALGARVVEATTVEAAALPLNEPATKILTDAQRAQLRRITTMHINGIERGKLQSAKPAQAKPTKGNYDPDVVAESFELDKDRNPSKKQQAAVRAGVEGKTLTEAAEWMAAHAPSPAHRVIAERVATTLRGMESTPGVVLDRVRVKTTNPRSARSTEARGFVVHGSAAGEYRVELELNDTQGAYSNGLSYATVLHELVHAATVAGVYVGRKGAGRNFAELNSRLEAVRNHVVATLTERMSNGTATEEELNIIRGRTLPNGLVSQGNTLLNTDELLAWGLTDPEFQRVLEGIPSEDGKSPSVWSQLVSHVRDYLGLPMRVDSALSDVLRLGEYTMSVNADAAARMKRSSASGRAPSKEQLLLTHVASVSDTPPMADRTVLTKGKFDAMVDSAATALGLKITGVETTADLERVTDHPIPSDVSGMVHDGTIYMVRNNIKNTNDFADVLAHERGHQGLRELMGDRTRAVTNRLWANASLRPRIRSKMQQQGLDRATAAEEVLVDMLANRERMTGDVLSKLRSAINAFVDRILGLSNYTMPDREVDNLLEDVAAYLRGGQVRHESTATVKGPIALDDMLGDPGPMDDIPVFSRAQEDIAQAVRSIRGDKAPNLIRDALKRATEAGAYAVDRARGKEGDNTASSRLLAFMPLNQMANFYGKLFDNGAGTNYLREIASLKRRMENRYNKLIHGKETMTYQSGEGDPGVEYDISPHEVSRRWDDFGRDPKTAKQAQGLNAMQQYATLYKLFPDRPWHKQADLNYGEQSFTREERQQRLAELLPLWESIGPQGQQLFRESQAVYATMWRTRFDALQAEVARGMGFTGAYNSPEYHEFVKTDKYLLQIGSDVRTAMQRMKAGPYSPLSRFGDHFVTVRDNTGDVVRFEAYDTPAQADVARARARKEFTADKGFKITRSQRKENEWSIDGLKDDVVTKMKTAIQGTMERVYPGQTGDPEIVALRAQLERDLAETYLQSLPQSSFLKHANKRKGVEGFSMDAARGFNDYLLRAARSISTLEFDGIINSTMTEAQSYITGKEKEGNDTGKMQGVFNAVKSQHAAARAAEQSWIVNRLTEFGFLQYMTSASQLFVNATQTFMVALPVLVGRYGQASGIKAVGAALNTFTRSRGNILGKHSALEENSMQKRVMQELFDRGVLDFTLTHDMNSLAKGDSLSTNRHWRTTMEVLSFFMAKSEAFNRQVTGIATIELEMARMKKAGEEIDFAKIADVAEDAVYDTQFDYSSSNKPKMMQGPTGKLILQFQQHRFNMLALMAKEIRDAELGKAAMFSAPLDKETAATARRTLSYLLGTQLAFAGAAGVVFAPVVFAIMDAFRDDEDLLDSETAFIQSMPSVITQGLFAGVVDPRRLSAGTLLPGFGERGYEPTDGSAEDVFIYHVMQNLGPWLGVGTDWARGASALANGDVVGFIEKAMPKPIRDATIGVREAVTGVRDANKVVYDDPGVWDTTTRVIGLRSGERLELDQLRGASYEASKRISTVTKRHLTRLAVSVATGDSELQQEAMADISAWNAAMPEHAITGQAIKSAIKSRFKTQAITDIFGVPMYKPPSQAISDAIGSD